MGVGGVISLLWFQRQLPKYATVRNCLGEEGGDRPSLSFFVHQDFIEMILMVTADHGAAVSGAHNTIVSARAGKDLGKELKIFFVLLSLMKNSSSSVGSVLWTAHHWAPLWWRFGRHGQGVPVGL